jgi:hypothetical protein
MLNPFFLQGSKSEQNLIQDLINEQLKIYGVDVHYIPRKYLTKKTIIKEVIESEFNNAYPIEAYVDTYDGYEGAGTLLTKFGVQPYNDLTLIISKERFENYISPLIKNQPNTELTTRPKEGDLIYFPLGDRLFEIKFVEHEVPFYQLQKTYVYNLKCELFRYQDELVDTGIEYIDDNVEQQGYIQTFDMIGAGVSATAVATIVNGGVTFVTVTNRGDGYKMSPSVRFSPPTSGQIASGIATMIGGITDLCEPDSSLLRVQGVEITNAGYGYTIPPTVEFYGGGGDGATAVASIGNGIVGIVTITNGGSGYTQEPIVQFIGSATIPAQARTTIVDGVVTRIGIITTGIGYTQSPSIIIQSPYMVGYGTYVYNETVVGSSSGYTGRVKSWNAKTNKLELSNITGDFIPGETLVGAASSASYKIKVVTVDNLIDPFAQNKEIQTEADTIIDFNEKNPFGTP